MCYQITSQTENCDLIVIQDTTHIATKLRNRLLKQGIILPMGTHKVSVDDLVKLVKNVQKSIHGLTQTDICPEDRMNFSSFQKIIDCRVIEALRKYVKGSEATVKYLHICSEITSCFLETDLKPLERVFKMYYSVFFLRIWRQFIASNRHYKVQDNFLTSNAYTCIEINALNLIKLIQKFRERNTPEQFLPAIFDSQTCEKSFRQFRSMGTVEFTRINFSLYELLNMIGRIEVQNDIAYFKLADSDVFFSNKRTTKTKVYPLPTDTEINKTIADAKNSAIEDAKIFGMTFVENIDNFKFQSKIHFDIDEDSEESFDLEENEIDISNETIDAAENIDENSPLVIVLDENGINRIVRKSTLVWMLSESTETLSKDRLRRFKISKKRKIDNQSIEI